MPADPAKLKVDEYWQNWLSCLIGSKCVIRQLSSPRKCRPFKHIKSLLLARDINSTTTASTKEEDMSSLAQGILLLQKIEIPQLQQSTFTYTGCE